MKPIVIALLVFASIACTTQLYTPSKENVNKVEPATLAELQQGRDLFENKCGKCHKIPKPGSHPKEEWGKIMDKMAPKAKLNSEQSSLVFKYVVNH